MFESMPAILSGVFGRPGFVRRRGGVADYPFTGIYVPQHVEISAGAQGQQYETLTEAVSVTTPQAMAMAAAKGDLLVLPHDPATPRAIAARRDDGWGMTLLVLRKTAGPQP